MEREKLGSSEMPFRRKTPLGRSPLSLLLRHNVLFQSSAECKQGYILPYRPNGPIILQRVRQRCLNYLPFRNYSYAMQRNEARRLPFQHQGEPLYVSDDRCCPLQLLLWNARQIHLISR